MIILTFKSLLKSFFNIFLSDSYHFLPIK